MRLFWRPILEIVEKNVRLIDSFSAINDGSGRDTSLLFWRATVYITVHYFDSAFRTALIIVSWERGGAYHRTLPFIQRLQQDAYGYIAMNLKLLNRVGRMRRKTCFKSDNEAGIFSSDLNIIWFEFQFMNIA